MHSLVFLVPIYFQPIWYPSQGPMGVEFLDVSTSERDALCLTTSTQAMATLPLKAPGLIWSDFNGLISWEESSSASCFPDKTYSGFLRRAASVGLGGELWAPLESGGKFSSVLSLPVFPLLSRYLTSSLFLQTCILLHCGASLPKVLWSIQVFALLYIKSGYCKSEDKLYVFCQNPGSCESNVLWLLSFCLCCKFSSHPQSSQDLGFYFSKLFIVPHGNAWKNAQRGGCTTQSSRWHVLGGNEIFLSENIFLLHRHQKRSEKMHAGMSSFIIPGWWEYIKGIVMMKVTRNPTNSALK